MCYFRAIELYIECIMHTDLQRQDAMDYYYQPPPQVGYGYPPPQAGYGYPPICPPQMGYGLTYPPIAPPGYPNYNPSQGYPPSPPIAAHGSASTPHGVYPPHQFNPQAGLPHPYHEMQAKTCVPGSQENIPPNPAPLQAPYPADCPPRWQLPASFVPRPFSRPPALSQGSLSDQRTPSLEARIPGSPLFSTHLSLSLSQSQERADSSCGNLQDLNLPLSNLKLRNPHGELPSLDAALPSIDLGGTGSAQVNVSIVNVMVTPDTEKATGSSPFEEAFVTISPLSHYESQLSQEEKERSFPDIIFAKKNWHPFEKVEEDCQKLWLRRSNS